jgi:hypothetical protein
MEEWNAIISTKVFALFHTHWDDFAQKCSTSNTMAVNFIAKHMAFIKGKIYFLLDKSVYASWFSMYKNLE